MVLFPPPWEEKVPLLRFDSGNKVRAKGLLLHLVRMLKQQLPIRMLLKQLLQQILLKQLIKEFSRGNASK